MELIPNTGFNSSGDRSSVLQKRCLLATKGILWVSLSVLYVTLSKVADSQGIL